MSIITQGFLSDYTITQGYNGSPKLNNVIVITDILLFKEDIPKKGGTKTDITDYLFFTETINGSGNFIRVITDYLIFQENGVSKLLDNVVVTVPTIVAFTTNKKQKQFWTTFISFHGAINLPNSEFGDTESNINEVMILKAVGGRRYSHVKTSRRRRLTYIFNLRYAKALEFQAFIDVSNLDWITVINWKREVWLCQIINNPVELVGISNGWYSIKIEMEGYKAVYGDYKCLE